MDLQLSRTCKEDTGAQVRIILPDIGARRRMLHSKPLFPDALYSAAQVRDLDARLIAAGTPGFELMQRAAHAAWRAIRRRWPDAKQLTVMAGRGNNAGDGYLIAALAKRAGWQVTVLAVGDCAALAGDARSAYEEAMAAHVDIQPWQQQALTGIVVDALLGTGLKGDVRAPYAQAIEAINDSGRPVVAVDLPSGLCADTGRTLGCAVRADLTVTFIGLKIGLFTGDAPDQVGECVFDDLQADPDIIRQTPVSIKRLDTFNLPRLAPRPPTAHKGMFGRVLVVGGDLGFGGAALLATESTLRCGAGMVTLATRPEHITAALARFPEVMSAGVSSANQLYALIEPASVLVVGPGLGQQPPVRCGERFTCAGLGRRRLEPVGDRCSATPCGQRNHTAPGGSRALAGYRYESGAGRSSGCGPGAGKEIQYRVCLERQRQSGRQSSGRPRTGQSWSSGDGDRWLGRCAFRCHRRADGAKDAALRRCLSGRLAPCAGGREMRRQRARARCR